MIVGAERAFGFQLLRDIVNHKPAENVFISPLSVFLALQMVESGAAGDTRDAMRKVLGLSDGGSDRLTASASDSLKIANALWTDRHFTLAPDFVKRCESAFGARAASLNFADPAAAAEINDRVKTNTNGKIDSIVTPDTIAQAALIITNAVYFAAKWRSEFPVSGTVDDVFHKTGGSTKTVPMMYQSQLRGAYRSGGNFEGAMLYYQESNMFFYALLPHSGNTPKDVLASLDVEHLDAGATDFDLELTLPRFNLDFSASLAEYLKEMGMGVAFRYPDADFSPMGSRQLFISDVFHKTRLEVDEKGTVAAAATAVTMRATAVMPQQPPKKVLVFDRPFVVVIGDSKTGAVLFAGVVEDPQ